MDDTAESTHRKIIITIHSKWRHGNPFSPAEVERAAEVSKSSVLRTLKLLIRIRLLDKTEHAFAGRHYSVSHRWPIVESSKDAMDMFEMAKILDV